MQQPLYPIRATEIFLCSEQDCNTRIVSTQLYGNISQAYRPYLYANVTPADRVDKIDPS